ncbi:MAG: G1 family glutamic endopeptidase [Candidatus Lutacidiplasmatales archaeon]
MSSGPHDSRLFLAWTVGVLSIMLLTATAGLANSRSEPLAPRSGLLGGPASGQAGPAPGGTPTGTPLPNPAWAGYVVCPKSAPLGCGAPPAGERIYGVSADWTVPSYASTDPNIEQGLVDWVGIGGWGSSDLVQAGIDESTLDGVTAGPTAWWEMLPQGFTFVTLSPDPTITPGDHVEVTVHYSGLDSLGHQQWTFAIGDLSTQSEWSGTEACSYECYPSNFSSADWIIEPPVYSGVHVQPPAFSSFEMRYADYEIGSPNASEIPLNSTATDSYTLSLEQTYDSGVIEALTSPVLAPGEFWFEMFVDAVDPDLSGTADLFNSGSTIEQGLNVSARFSVNSPDAFSPSSVPGLSLELELKNGTTARCMATSSSASALTFYAGFNPFDFRAPVCANIPDGTYSVRLGLWYSPNSTSPGTSGSLELYSTTFGNLTVRMDGPVASAVTFASAHSETDVGSNLTIRVNVTGGMSPFTFRWTGLPPGCGAMNGSSVICRPSVSANYTVGVRVTDEKGAVSFGASRSLEVFSDPQVSIDPIADGLRPGDSLTLGSNVSGGAPPVALEWAGLPSGCRPENASTVNCSSMAAGTYEISLTVTDGAGVVVSANASVLVSSPNGGVSSVEVFLLVGIPLAIAALGGLAYHFRRRRPPEAEELSPAPPTEEGV